MPDDTMQLAFDSVVFKLHDSEGTLPLESAKENQEQNSQSETLSRVSQESIEQLVKNPGNPTSRGEFMHGTVDVAALRTTEISWKQFTEAYQNITTEKLPRNGISGLPTVKELSDGLAQQREFKSEKEPKLSLARLRMCFFKGDQADKQKIIAMIIKRAIYDQFAENVKNNLRRFAGIDGVARLFYADAMVSCRAHGLEFIPKVEAVQTTCSSWDEKEGQVIVVSIPAVIEQQESLEAGWNTFATADKEGKNIASEDKSLEQKKNTHQGTKSKNANAVITVQTIIKPNGQYTCCGSLLVDAKQAELSKALIAQTEKQNGYVQREGSTGIVNDEVRLKAIQELLSWQLQAPAITAVGRVLNTELAPPVSAELTRRCPTYSQLRTAQLDLFPQELTELIARLDSYLDQHGFSKGVITLAADIAVLIKKYTKTIIGHDPKLFLEDDLGGKEFAHKEITEKVRVIASALNMMVYGYLTAQHITPVELSDSSLVAKKGLGKILTGLFDLAGSRECAAKKETKNPELKKEEWIHVKKEFTSAGHDAETVAVNSILDEVIDRVMVGDSFSDLEEVIGALSKAAGRDEKPNSAIVTRHVGVVDGDEKPTPTDEKIATLCKGIFGTTAGEMARAIEEGNHATPKQFLQFSKLLTEDKPFRVAVVKFFTENNAVTSASVSVYINVLKLLSAADFSLASDFTPYLNEIRNPNQVRLKELKSELAHEPVQVAALIAFLDFIVGLSVRNYLARPKEVKHESAGVGIANNILAAIEQLKQIANPSIANYNQVLQNIRRLQQENTRFLTVKDKALAAALSDIPAEIYLAKEQVSPRVQEQNQERNQEVKGFGSPIKIKQRLTLPSDEMEYAESANHLASFMKNERILPHELKGELFTGITDVLTSFENGKNQNDFNFVAWKKDLAVAIHDLFIDSKTNLLRKAIQQQLRIKIPPAQHADIARIDTVIIPRLAQYMHQCAGTLIEGRSKTKADGFLRKQLSIKDCEKILREIHRQQETEKFHQGKIDDKTISAYVLSKSPLRSSARKVESAEAKPMPTKRIAVGAEAKHQPPVKRETSSSSTESKSAFENGAAKKQTLVSTTTKQKKDGNVERKPGAEQKVSLRSTVQLLEADKKKIEKFRSLLREIGNVSRVSRGWDQGLFLAKVAWVFANEKDGDAIAELLGAARITRAELDKLLGIKKAFTDKINAGKADAGKANVDKVEMLFAAVNQLRDKSFTAVEDDADRINASSVEIKDASSVEVKGNAVSPRPTWAQKLSVEQYNKLQEEVGKSFTAVIEQKANKVGDEKKTEVVSASKLAPKANLTAEQKSNLSEQWRDSGEAYLVASYQQNPKAFVRFHSYLNYGEWLKTYSKHQGTSRALDRLHSALQEYHRWCFTWNSPADRFQKINEIKKWALCCETGKNWLNGDRGDQEAWNKLQKEIDQELNFTIYVLPGLPKDPHIKLGKGRELPPVQQLPQQQGLLSTIFDVIATPFKYLFNATVGAVYETVKQNSLEETQQNIETGYRLPDAYDLARIWGQKKIIGQEREQLGMTNETAAAIILNKVLPVASRAGQPISQDKTLITTLENSKFWQYVLEVPAMRQFCYAARDTVNPTFSTTCQSIYAAACLHEYFVVAAKDPLLRQEIQNDQEKLTIILESTRKILSLAKLSKANRNSIEVLVNDKDLMTCMQSLKLSRPGLVTTWEEILEFALERKILKPAAVETKSEQGNSSDSDDERERLRRQSVQSDALLPSNQTGQSGSLSPTPTSPTQTGVWSKAKPAPNYLPNLNSVDSLRDKSDPASPPSEVEPQSDSAITRRTAKI